MQLLDMQDKSDECKWPFMPRPPPMVNSPGKTKHTKHVLKSYK